MEKKDHKKLFDKMLSAKVGQQSPLNESKFLSAEMVQTELPILNIAFAGDVDGGMISGLTFLAGESKTFKSLLGLYCMKAYLDKYEDAVVLFYDSEFGITTEYLQMQGIDISRVIHIPIDNVEVLKFDIVKKLDNIEEGDRVFIFVDSIGMLASKKELQDAIDEKAVADMSRAKAIRSMLRIITPTLTSKNIPCIMINHTYQTQEIYSKTVVGGGTAIQYAANQIFIIKKTAIKNEKTHEIEGFRFEINIEKSRAVRQGAKLPFFVYFEDGIDPYSSLFDLALEFEFIVKSGSWYQLVDPTSGEIDEKKIRQAAIPNTFYDNLLTDDKFKQMVKDRFKL